MIGTRLLPETAHAFQLLADKFDFLLLGLGLSREALDLVFQLRAFLLQLRFWPLLA